MNILVTGATGFIGKHLVKELLKNRQYQVFCFVRNHQKAKELEQAGAQLIYGDILDKASLNALQSFQMDIVFHCAACVENNNRQKLYAVNVEGTRNICELSMLYGLKRFVYLSSVAVVSGNKEIPLREELPFKATNLYGESKIAAEKVVLEFRTKGLPVVILRPPMIYGEDEPHMLRLLLKLLKFRILPLANRGENKLHLAYIGNVIAAMIFCLDQPEFLAGSFFVADKEVLTTGEIFRNFCLAIGAKPPLILSKPAEFLLLHLPILGRKLKFFLKDRVYSTGRIESLGFKPPYAAKASLLNSAKKLYYAK